MKTKTNSLFITGILVLLMSLPSTAQQWTLLNPDPTFQNLFAVSFPSPDTGYIVGDKSTVLRTFDGGETWTKLDFPVQDVQLRSVNFNSTTHGIIVAWSHIATTWDAGETWSYTQLQLNGDYEDSFILNDSLGWVVCSSSAILKTTDGGLSWNQVNGNQSGWGDLEIGFANADTGYMAGYYGNMGDIPSLRRTLNGGQNWENVTIPSGIPGIASVSVLGAQDIWIAARNPIFSDSTGLVFNAYHTVDGGLNWTTHNIGEADGSYVRKVEFLNANEGRILTYSKIYSTSDGGANWTNYNIGSNWFSTLADFSWTDANTCAVVGYGPEISITKDNGNTWESKMKGEKGFFRSVFFHDENNGFIGGISEGGASILKTIDGGDTWANTIVESAAYDDQIASLTFPSPTIGWASTYGSKVFHSINGGESWQPISTGFTYHLSRLCVTDENHIFLADDNAKIVKSSDGGISWVEISPQTASTYYLMSNLHFTDNLNGYIGTYANNIGKLLKTSDGGQSWSELDYGSANNVRNISFSDNNHGTIHIQDIGIRVTQDGGQTWSEPSYISPYISTIKWMDANHGIAGYSDSFVAVTEDGGYTWITTYDQPSSGGSINSLFFLNENIAWACGNNGLIMRYNETYVGIDSPLASQKYDSFFFPNPANDLIQLKEGDYTQIRIFSMEGKLIQSIAQPNSNTLNISALKSGIYVVEAISLKGTLRQKLMKE